MTHPMVMLLLGKTPACPVPSVLLGFPSSCSGECSYTICSLGAHSIPSNQMVGTTWGAGTWHQAYNAAGSQKCLLNEKMRLQEGMQGKGKSQGGFLFNLREGSVGSPSS